MAYIGVGEHTMCKECGVDVRNRFLHDNYHAELDKLRAENRELTAKVENLRRFVNRKPNELVGV